MFQLFQRPTCPLLRDSSDETPKKFVDELDSYNGIQYLETYIAE